MRTAQGNPSGIEQRFVPVAFDNEKDAEPITVWFKTPTEKDKRELMAIGRRIVTRKGATIEIEESALDALATQHATIQRLVSRVENYKAAGGKPILDGTALAAEGESPIVTEVYTAILKAMFLSGEEEKKSEGSQG